MSLWSNGLYHWLISRWNHFITFSTTAVPLLATPHESALLYITDIAPPCFLFVMSHDKGKLKITDSRLLHPIEGWYLWFQTSHPGGERWRMQSVLVEEASLELGTVDTNSLLTLLECPVCLDHITPPIKQCTKVKHTTRLKTELNPGSPGLHWLLPPFASLSDMSIANGRGEELGDGAGEKSLGKFCHLNNWQVSRLLKFPCRYHPMGCKEAHSLSAKAEHERNCPYLQLKCPFHGQCSFGGALSAVVPHLKSEHAVTPVPGRLCFLQKH